MRFSLVLIAVLSAAAPASAFTLEQVMSAPFCSGLVAAARAPRIAWTVNVRGERNVWAAEAPAWRPHAVTHYRGDTGQPLGALALSPDGKLAVFVHGGDGEHTPNPTSLAQPPKRQVIAAAADGTDEPRVLGDGGDDLQLSPDGSQVAWQAKHQLWVAPVDASAPARAIAELRGELADVRWSPDGKRIALSVDRKSHALIAVVDLGGEAVRWIAPSTARDGLPRWSPDGRQLAFVRIAGLERRQPAIPVRPLPWAVWIADAQSGKARAVWTSGGAARDSLPYLEPDLLCPLRPDHRSGPAPAPPGRAGRGDRLPRRDPRPAPVAELGRRLPRHRGVLHARAVATAGHAMFLPWSMV